MRPSRRLTTGLLRHAVDVDVREPDRIAVFHGGSVRKVPLEQRSGVSLAEEVGRVPNLLAVHLPADGQRVGSRHVLPMSLQELEMPVGHLAELGDPFCRLCVHVGDSWTHTRQPLEKLPDLSQRRLRLENRR